MIHNSMKVAASGIVLDVREPILTVNLEETAGPKYISVNLLNPVTKQTQTILLMNAGARRLHRILEIYLSKMD